MTGLYHEYTCIARDGNDSRSLSSEMREDSVLGCVDVDSSLRTSHTSPCQQTAAISRQPVSLRGRVHFYPSNLSVNTEPCTLKTICYEGISGNYVHDRAVMDKTEEHSRANDEVDNSVSIKAMLTPPETGVVNTRDDVSVEKACHVPDVGVVSAPRTHIIDCSSDSEDDVLVQKSCLDNDVGVVPAPRPRIIDCCSESDSDPDPPSTPSPVPVPVPYTTYIDRDQLFPGSVFDSHCHLDFIYRRLKGQGQGSVQSLKQCLAMDGEDLGESFGGCVANFCNPMDWCQGQSGRLVSKDIEDSTKDRRVFLSIGCHPHFADRMLGNRTDQLALLVSGKSIHLPGKVVAVGECGLDYSRKNTVGKELQKQVFTNQLKIAMQYKLPLVLHIRDAEADGYEVLAAAGVPVDWPIHRHCFTGGWEEASLWLDKYRASKIGITGIVTYQAKMQVREVVKKIPLERLLLETDAPYFLPARVDKTKYPWNCALPGHIIHVAAQVAAIKGVALRTVLEKNLMNVNDVYNVGKVSDDGAETENKVETFREKMK